MNEILDLASGNFTNATSVGSGPILFTEWFTLSLKNGYDLYFMIVPERRVETSINYPQENTHWFLYHQYIRIIAYEKQTSIANLTPFNEYLDSIRSH